MSGRSAARAFAIRRAKGLSSILATSASLDTMRMGYGKLTHLNATRMQGARALAMNPRTVFFIIGCVLVIVIGGTYEPDVDVNLVLIRGVPAEGGDPRRTDGE